MINSKHVWGMSPEKKLPPVAEKEIVWTNEESKPMKNFECHVPDKIVDVIRQMDSALKGYEFSIFCKAEWDKDEKRFVVGEEYFIPEQRVSSAFVDYKEDPGDEWDCVIHKHPTGIKSFSSTDDTYINQNFKYSLLWESGKFVKGILNTFTEFGQRIQMDLIPTISKRLTDTHLMDLITKKIKVDRTSYTKTVTTPNYTGTLYEEDIDIDTDNDTHDAIDWLLDYVNDNFSDYEMADIDIFDDEDYTVITKEKLRKEYDAEFVVFNVNNDKPVLVFRIYREKDLAAILETYKKTANDYTLDKELRKETGIGLLNVYLYDDDSVIYNKKYITEQIRIKLS